MQRQTFDSGYLQRLAQGDPETERNFTDYFGELLAIKLRPRLRCADAIEDVTQETFLRVFKVIRSSGIDTPEALGAFVNSVCNNVLFELYRRQSHPADGSAEEVPGESRVEEEFFAAEECESVRRVLAGMPEKDRTILQWVFFEEREKGEVCRSLGVDREYLRVLVHRAKSKFRSDWIKRAATKAARSTPMG